MGIFLIDKNKVYTYSELLNVINERDAYIPAFQGSNLFSFFCNLILGLVSNQSLMLLDEDFTETELKTLGVDNVNQEVCIKKPYFETIEDLIDTVRKSQSHITIFTSGTTGQPKQITHLYYNLSRAVKVGAKFSDNIWGYAYNPTHMAGLQVFFQAFENANTLVNIFRLTREEIYESIAQNSITHISATPTFYRLLLPFDNTFDSIRRITFGGEKSDQKLHDTIQQIFPKASITNIYASTEAGTLFASHGSDFRIPIDIRDKVKVENDELYIHSSLLGTSSSLKLDDGYYPTGDLIEWVDKELGIFKFKSRKNELINIGGYKVNPQEVEEVIRSMEGVHDVYVYGKSNSILGKVVCADVHKSEGSSLTESGIRAFLQDKLQEFKIPRRIKFVESIGTTRTGKMKRL